MANYVKITNLTPKGISNPECSSSSAIGLKMEDGNYPEMGEGSVRLRQIKKKTGEKQWIWENAVPIKKS